MRIKGKVRDGKVVLPEGVELPEGAEVDVIVRERVHGEELLRKIERLRARLRPLDVSVLELIREGKRS